MTILTASSAIIIALCILSPVTCVVVRDYNEVNHKVYDTYSEFFDVFFTLAGGNSNTNVFVGVTEPQCADRLETAAFRGAQRHAGGNVVSVATVPSEGFPIKLAACAEVFWFPFNTSIYNPLERTVNLGHVDLTRWGGERMPTHIDFFNDFEFPIQLWWLEESHEPVKQGVIKPGKGSGISSYLGHVFAAREYINGDETDPLVDFFSVQENVYRFKPVNRLETCEIVPGSQRFVEQELSCDDMELRLTEFTHQVWYHKRLGLNYVQPQMVRPVTSAGFENRRLPESTYAWLKAWYDSEKLRDEKTESAVGPCMNQHVSPSSVTHLTKPYKDRLSVELQPVLEEWYGGELFMTSIYGIRKYINGSVLRMHVDTVNTHVVSAIINVDQEVDVEWPLLILDHNDNEHRVIMKPGDMLLYESAKLLHGRPDPFVGSHYDNIFIHYKPTSGWDYSWV